MKLTTIMVMIEQEAKVDASKFEQKVASNDNDRGVW